MPTLADELLGADLAAVTARLGAPAACQLRGGVLMLTYADRLGRPLERAVEITDGVVVAVDDDASRCQAAGTGRELVGWPVEVALAGFGPPRAVTRTGETCRYEFDGFSVLAHEGAVAFVSDEHVRRGA